MCCGGDTQQTTQASASTLPPWIAGPAQNFVSRSEALSNNPFTPYAGARTADFTGDQQAGFQDARNAAGAATPYLNQAADYTRAGAGGIGSTYTPQSYSFDAVSAPTVGTGQFDQAAADKYMSPYRQSVIDRTMQEMQRQSNLQGQNIDAAAVKAGAFGGDRAQIAHSELDRNTLQTMGNTAAQLNDQAYTQAGNLFNQDQGRALSAGMTNAQLGLGAQEFTSSGNLQAQGMGDQSQRTAAQLEQGDLSRQLQAGQQMAGIGGAQQQAGLQGANALMGIGGLQQGLNQQNLNTAYGDFQNQVQWPYQQLGFANSILRGTPMPQQMNSTTTAPAPSALNGIAGLGLTGLGVVGATGGFGQNGWFGPAVKSGFGLIGS